MDERPSIEPDTTTNRLVDVVRWLMEVTSTQQTDLVEATKMSPGQVSKFVNYKEVAQFEPTLDKAWRLAKAMKCTKAEFEALVRDLTSYGLKHGHRCLRVGSTPTLWWHMTGLVDGSPAIDCHNIEVRWDPSIAFEPNEALEELARGARKNPGKHKAYLDNPRLAVAAADWGGSRGRDRRPWITLRTYPVPYVYPFALRQPGRGRQYIRERMQQWRPDGPLQPDTSLSIGVHVALSTRDGRFILAQRSELVGLRKGELEVGAVEGLSFQEDVIDAGLQETSAGRIDLERVVNRALKDEYGIDKERVKEVVFLGAGFDLQYAQWNVLALANLACSGDDVIEAQKTAPDSFEHSNVWAVPETPRDVFEAMHRKDEAIWSSGIVLAYLSLVQNFTRDEVDAAARGMDLMHVRKHLWK